jgi:hypothetical protein
MGKSSGGSSRQPKDVDMGLLAEDQSELNIDAILASARINRFDESSPYGTVTWEKIPGEAGPKEPEVWGHKIRGSGDVESSGNKELISGGDQSQGIDRYRRVVTLSPEEQAALDRKRAMSTAVDNWAIGQGQYLPTGALNFDGITEQVSNVDTSDLPDYMTGVDTSDLPDYMTGVDTSGFADYISGIDLDSLPTMPGVDDFGEERLRVEDALYGRATDRLDPRFKNLRTDLESKLANQGIMVGSEAWQRENDQLGRDSNDAYSQARNDAILFGGGEQSRLFGISSQARAQMAQELLENANMSNITRGQEFSEGLSNANMNNTTRSQLFGEGLSNANMNNTTRSQLFGEGVTNANLANQARQQGINERMTLRTQPLNEILAAYGMSGVNVPTPAPTAQYQVAAPDILGATMSQQALASQAASTNADANAGTKGSSIGAAGALGAAAIMAFSDEDMKENIKSTEGVLEALQKVPSSTYNYKGDAEPRIGPMAQDWQKQFGGDGKTIPMPQAFGASLAAINELTTRIKKLEAA